MSRTTALRLSYLALPLALAAIAAPGAHAAQAAPAWERANESIRCSDTEGSSPFYNGPSASTVYDATFRLGHTMPQAMLDGYVPQGLGTWKNWGGPGKHLLVQSAYNDETDRAVIAGMVPGGGTTALATLTMPGKRGGYVNAHVGGVAVVRDWLWVAGPQRDGKATVLRYSLAAAQQALQTGGLLRAQAQITLPVPAGFAASFLAPQGTSLWIGTFDGAQRNRMHRFGVTKQGTLRWKTGIGGWVQIPKKSQGLAVTKSHFVFSTSYGRNKRSNVYVIKRGHKYLDDAYPQHLRCFAAPSMSEGITFSGGKAFLSFESGSYKYRSSPLTRNKIVRLHLAPRKALLAMVP